MKSSTSNLPIYDVADDLLAGLAATGRVVLSAPTGSGKSTQVPQILLDRSGIEGEIVVLQPRRLAARLLAKRVAFERGVKLGEEVGYQIRFENVVSARTRIRFVTEAILLRQILSDPGLKGVGAVVFDEFHERHLTSDLSLACALQSVAAQRPDLKLVVMSATLDIDVLQSYLDPCARVEASGRMYPVEVSYTGAALGRQAAPVWERAASAFKKSIAGQVEGDVLIFMPGAFEIRKTMEAIQALPESRAYEVLPLHGELPPDAQDRAVSSGERPKIIVSTNVAETSITIDGVRAVIDGGLARIARYDARRGINSILVEPISRASSEQRAGRAGRTGPGVCLRLWSEAEHLARSERDEAEVKRVDLSETVLMLAAAGICNLTVFPWFEAPTDEALRRAYQLLQDLGAFEGMGAVTDMTESGELGISPLGRQMSDFPLHPRYARLLIEGDRLGVLPDVALIAALSQGRPFYRAAREDRVRREQLRQIEDHADARSDYFVHLKAWELAQAAKFNAHACAALGIHGGAARQASAVAQQILRLAEKAGLDTRSGPLPDFEERICKCILVAFSDHLALRNDRGTRRCRMVHGRSGELRRESVVESVLLVASELEERELRGEVTVLLGLATAVEPQWLEALFGADFSEGTATSYDASARRVVCRTERRFRDLVLQAKDQGEPDYDQAAALLAAEVQAGKLNLKHWDAAVENWIQRVNFVARHCPETEIAAIDDEARQLLIEQICHGALSYKEIKDRPVLDTVKDWIRPEQLYYIDTYAPAEMDLPRRKRPARIRYEADGRAIIASKLQDFYDVPGAQLRVANGQVPLLVELLAPNQRPAHLTEDLDGFWSGAYAHVRKELAGRYPKHEWR
ncbi:ATP-dependent helicase HrpB [Coraliomargarita sp. SDUM461003]|uniref:ATP-dependent helicase HrpB n=1 Tax=Thalassobacterium maritimum TaxID=3041265 RepID=A0ABU1ARM7_9BACT|nr:ATP-dependent helicase HrpB [Coraliomargarita sp. SDUM461003]MDQ8206819.1 ATP-dependent helicase HrpB [Coraliomargarita sp. SDUM461003]